MPQIYKLRQFVIRIMCMDNDKLRELHPDLMKSWPKVALQDLIMDRSFLDDENVLGNPGALRTTNLCDHFHTHNEGEKCPRIAVVELSADDDVAKQVS